MPVHVVPVVDVFTADGGGAGGRMFPAEERDYLDEALPKLGPVDGVVFADLH